MMMVMMIPKQRTIKGAQISSETIGQIVAKSLIDGSSINYQQPDRWLMVVSSWSMTVS